MLQIEKKKPEKESCYLYKKPSASIILTSCDLCLEGINQNLVSNTSSCYDDHLCCTITKSHHKQQSYGPETNLLQGRPVTKLDLFSFGSLNT